MRSRVQDLGDGRIVYDLPEHMTPRLDYVIGHLDDILFPGRRERKDPLHPLLDEVLQKSSRPGNPIRSGTFVTLGVLCRVVALVCLDEEHLEASRLSYQAEDIEYLESVVSKFRRGYRALLKPVLDRDEFERYAARHGEELAASDLRWGMGFDETIEARDCIIAADSHQNGHQMIMTVAAMHDGINRRQRKALIEQGTDKSVYELYSGTIRQWILQTHHRTDRTQPDEGWKEYIDYLVLSDMDDSQLLDAIENGRDNPEWLWSVYSKYGRMDYGSMETARAILDEGAQAPYSWVESWGR